MFVPGQRWISETEPELGLGTVLEADERQVRIGFAGSDAIRQYAAETAPLKRVRFREGDQITDVDGVELTVTSVSEHEGLLVYSDGNRAFAETELSDAIGFYEPRERLLAGHVDEPSLFDLRCRTLEQRHRLLTSPTHGFLGGRVELIPHQFFIAQEVANRKLPRVLLADEVGLGKTIEAGLIVHRLLQTGRVSRVLLMVPPSLVHQWFVEMYRRFNLWFNIFDNDRCEAIETNEDSGNPFLDEQLVICDTELCIRHPQRGEQVWSAQWDVLVVDEAHHLAWAPEDSSPEYRLVEALASRTPGVLLLTATPEQLGQSGHFARLRLLDPARFGDLEQFIKESEGFHLLARVVDKLLQGQALSSDEQTIADSLGRLADDLSPKSAEEVRAAALGELIDRHGPSRVIFRNTRRVIPDFPKRVPTPIPLTADAKLRERLQHELMIDIGAIPEAALRTCDRDDPRLQWLVEFLQADEDRKVLLLCSSRQKVETLAEVLPQLVNVKLSVFHEGLSLLQRDRNAAWFAEPDGAVILICSEIGSEGRNFQFAHHLVLFDLPLNPELLEQRIGRLDRIGQTESIRIHIPYVEGTGFELLARWYDDGLAAFGASLVGGFACRREFESQITDLIVNGGDERAITALIADTRTFHQLVKHKLEQGRNRLLELSSFRAEHAQPLLNAIQEADEDLGFDDYILVLLEQFGVHVEELGHRMYLLLPNNLATDAISLPGDGLSVASKRGRALVRDDLTYLTWEHPLVQAAMDAMLGAELGNASFAHIDDGSADRIFLLEAMFVLETVAPASLHIGRFLAPTPLRVVVDHQLQDVTAQYPRSRLSANARAGTVQPLLENPMVTQTLIPRLLEQAEQLCEARVATVIDDAIGQVKAQLLPEVERLQALRALNPTISEQEVALAAAEPERLIDAMKQARLRLDAVRMILCGPPL